MYILCIGEPKYAGVELSLDPTPSLLLGAVLSDDLSVLSSEGHPC